jgi:acetyl esterase/lipase
MTFALRMMAGALAVVAPLGILGCLETTAWLVMPFHYEKALISADRVATDIAYRSDAAADPDKHRLDLFLPDPAVAAAWPVMVFVHGGGWTSGDRALRMGGRDVYRNIGRFFAGRGVATAVVSYRLQFEFSWLDQVDDVARAVAWTQRNIGRYGGDARSLFLVGHSAGAYLAARVAFDRELTARQATPDVCGIVSVSGAGLDLGDEETYALGAKREYYERRFRNGDPGDAWVRQASPVSYVTRAAPPALLLYAQKDWPALRRQAHVLGDALAAAGVPKRVVEIPDEDHYSIAVALSRAGSTTSEAILRFVGSNAPRCAERQHGDRES